MILAGKNETSVTTKAGEIFHFPITIPVGMEIEVEIDNQALKSRLKTDNTGIYLDIPQEKTGIVEIDYSIIDKLASKEEAGKIMLRITPAEKEVKADNNSQPNDKNQSNNKKKGQEKDLQQPPVLKEGDYYISVFKAEEEIFALRREMKKNKSLIVGKYSSRKSNPDIDLKELFTTKKSAKKCSRHQLKIFWSQNKWVIVKNISEANSVKVANDKLAPGKHCYLKPETEITISDEITLKLLRG